MKISVSNFAGERPAVDPRVLADNQAQRAENCYVKQGVLKGVAEMNPVDAAINDGGVHTVDGATTESIKRFSMRDFVDGEKTEEQEYLFRIQGDVDMVRSPLAQKDRWDRVFISGWEHPKYTAVGLAMDGDGAYPRRTFRLGVPAPEEGASAQVGINRRGEGTFRFDLTYFWEDKDSGERYNQITLPPPDEVPEIYHEFETGDHYTVDLTELRDWRNGAGASAYSSRMTGGGTATTGSVELTDLLAAVGLTDKNILRVDGLVRHSNIEESESDDTPIDGFDFVKVVRQIANGHTDLNAVVDGALYDGAGMQFSDAERVTKIIDALNANGNFITVVQSQRVTEIEGYFAKHGSTSTQVDTVPETAVMVVGVRIYNKRAHSKEIGRAFTYALSKDEGYDPKYDDGYNNRAIRIEASNDRTVNHYTVRVIYDDVEGGASTVTKTTQYAYTYVSVLGEEGPPRVIPGTLNVTAFNDVTLSGLVQAPDEYENLRQFTLPGTAPVVYNGKRRIYRLTQGASSAAWMYVGEIRWDQDEYIDGVFNDMDLPGGMLESTDYDPPPSDLKGLCALPNGVLAGYSGSEICFSAPYLPYAWPVKYRHDMTGDVLALYSSTYGLVAFPKDNPPVGISGQHPESMMVSEIPTNAALTNSGVVVRSPTGVFYMSQEGLVSLTSQGVDDSLWDATIGDLVIKGGSTFRSFFFDDCIYIIPIGRPVVFVIDVKSGELFRLHMGEDTINGVTLEPNNGQFLISTSDGVRSWDLLKGESWGSNLPGTMEYRWRSKRFNMVNPTSLSVVRVDSSGDGTLEFSSDLADWSGTYQITAGKNSYRLPAGLIRELEFTLSGSSDIRLVEFASSVAELHHG